MTITFDTLITNAAIFGHEDADAIAIDHGRIVYIGRDRGIRSKNTLDLSGKIVLPGFIDSHAHLMSTGLELSRLNLFNAPGKKEAIDEIRSYAEKHDKVIAYRWDESRWDDDRSYLTAHDLNSIEKPVVAFRRDAHMAVVNDAAMRSIGQFRPDGVFREEEMVHLKDLIRPDYEEASEALSMALDTAVSLGITGVRDIVDRMTYDTYCKIKIPIRIFKVIYSNELFDGFGADEFDWGVKEFLDGSLGSRTAAHGGWDERNLKMKERDFEAFAQTIWSRNLPLAVHAIGEIAVEVAAKTMHRHAGKQRNSIEHFELVEDGILDMIDDNTIISAQPNFLEWAGHGGMYEDRLGSEWLYRNNPYRDILDSGIRLAFGSDSMPIGPMYGIHYAVNSEFRQQRLTFEEAVRSYSEAGSYLLGLEKWVGLIETGYSADFAVFDQSSLLAHEKLKDARPTMTIFEGKIVYFRS
ncbi:amidohydrolase [Thermoplasma sp. Kam2015]|uniref:amidohydrolase n=1 Tax=Thermoplasma sp. Kam2015 TaxID=2094122 RepID=UPI000D946DF4|nr:amidohydrolase [Thermoplasma sp. Kam2015]PYB68386.1 amidohydrolase [Thermoplasma sp. Kam2015]